MKKKTVLTLLFLSANLPLMASEGRRRRQTDHLQIAESGESFFDHRRDLLRPRAENAPNPFADPESQEVEKRLENLWETKKSTGDFVIGLLRLFWEACTKNSNS